MINLQFSDVKRRLLAGPRQTWIMLPMVDLDAKDLSARLQSLRKHLKMKSAEFAALAGRTAQAATKWYQGGGVTDEHLMMLAAKGKISFLELKYGRQVARTLCAECRGTTRQEEDVTELLKFYHGLHADQQNELIEQMENLVAENLKKNELERQKFEAALLKTQGTKPS